MNKIERIRAPSSGGDAVVCVSCCPRKSRVCFVGLVVHMFSTQSLFGKNKLQLIKTRYSSVLLLKWSNIYLFLMSEYNGKILESTAMLINDLRMRTRRSDTARASSKGRNSSPRTFQTSWYISVWSMSLIWQFRRYSSEQVSAIEFRTLNLVLVRCVLYFYHN